MLDIWYHICLNFDLKTNEIEASVNRQPIGRVHVKSVSNKPDKLKIKIGLGHDNEQFQGSITNIKMLEVVKASNTFSSPCKQEQDDILSWSPGNWNLIGPQWALIEEFEDEVCVPSNFYDLAIPSKMTIHESMDICKHKLNNSIIPAQEDRELFLNYIDWHNVTSGGVCPYIWWTPFSDEQSEGSFINVNNDTETTLQSWVDIELNGDADENFLEIVVAEKALNDAPENSGNCGSCIIPSSLLLKLDGRCRGSLIGEILHIIGKKELYV